VRGVYGLKVFRRSKRKELDEIKQVGDTSSTYKNHQKGEVAYFGMAFIPVHSERLARYCQCDKWALTESSTIDITCQKNVGIQRSESFLKTLKLTEN
jgi:hypothetical protein